MNKNLMLKECILSDSLFILADYKVGQKVYFKPKLSGFDNKTPLIVHSIRIETHDFLGNEYEVPFYVYSFENSSLSAYETQLTSCTDEL